LKIVTSDSLLYEEWWKKKWRKNQMTVKEKKTREVEMDEKMTE